MLILKAIKFDTIDWEHQFTNKEYKALVAQKGEEIKEKMSEFVTGRGM